MTNPKENIPSSGGGTPNSISPVRIIGTNEVNITLSSSVDAFNRYLEKDMRIHHSRLDDKSIQTLNKFKEKFILWKNVAESSSNYLKQKAVSIPYGVAALAALPAAGYILGQFKNPSTQAYLHNRIPKALPISSIFIKQPTQVSWETVDHAQFLNSIDWKHIDDTKYKPDSTFVLFRPDMALNMQDHYLGKIEPSEESCNLKAKDEKKSPLNAFSQHPKGGFTLQRTNTKNNLFNINQHVKRVHKFFLHRVFNKSQTVTASKLSYGKSLSTIKAIQHLDDKYLWKLTDHIQDPKGFILKRQQLQKMGRSTPHKAINYFKQISFAKAKPVQEVQVTTTRNYHLLFNEQTIQKTNEKLQTQWGFKPPKPGLKQLTNHYYWQTYFHAFDLIPLKMESLTYLNVQPCSNETKLPKLSSQKLKRVQEHKEYWAKKKNQEKKQREKVNQKLNKVYKNQIKSFHKTEKREAKILKKDPSFQTTIDKRKALEKKKTGFDEFDATKEKPILNPLIQAQQNALFQPGRQLFTHEQRQQIGLESESEIGSTEPLQRQKEKEDTLFTNTMDGFNKRISIPPLFNNFFIEEKTQTLDPPAGTKKRTRLFFSQPKKVTLEPKTKIDVLTHQLQFELTKSLLPDLSFNPRTRYQVYNGLFRFKNLMGSLYNQVDADMAIKPGPLISDGRLLNNRPTSRSNNKSLNLQKSLLYENLIVDLRHNEINYPNKLTYRQKIIQNEQNRLRIDPNVNIENDRFHFNRRHKQFYRRLMFNCYEVFPMVQKNWFSNIQNQLRQLNCYQEYRDFYEMFFIKNARMSSPTFKLDDLLNSSEKKKFLQKNTLIDQNSPEETLIDSIDSFGQNSDTSNIKKVGNYSTNTADDFDLTSQAEINQLADSFTQALVESDFIENLTEYLNTYFMDETDTEVLNPLKRSKNAFTKLQTKQRIQKTLTSNRELVDKYKAKLALNKPNENLFPKTTFDIRQSVVEGHSPFLKRQLSGYLNPDASFKDKYIELMSWENLFHNSKCVQAWNKKSFIKFPLSKNTTNSPLFQIVGTHQQNFINFQRLVNANNPTPFHFNTFNKLTIKEGNPFVRDEHINFYGHVQSNYGILYNPSGPEVIDIKKEEAKEKKEEKAKEKAKAKAKAKSTGDSESENEDLPYDLGWEEAVEKEYVMDQDCENLAHKPYAMPSTGDMDDENLWLYQNRFGHLVHQLIQPQLKRIPSINKSFDYASHPYFSVGINRLNEQNDWVNYGASYLGYQEPIDAFLLDLNKNKTGVIHYSIKSLTSPEYLSLIIFSYFILKAFQRIDADYRRSVTIGVQDFLNKLDLSTLKKITEVNKAVIESTDVGFEDVVGGARILNLFYPLILSLRKQFYFFNGLPVSSFSLLQTLSSSSLTLTEGRKIHLHAPCKTDYETAMEDRFSEQTLRQHRYSEMGYLLIGPPGTGKTHLVKALAGESKVPVIIPSKYTLAVQAQSAVDTPLQNSDDVLKIRQLFELAETRKPCILFLDEVDSLGPDRQDVLVDTKNKNSIGPDFLLKPSPLVENKAFHLWRNKNFINFETLNLDKGSSSHWTTYNPVQTTKELSETINETSAYTGSIEIPNPEQRSEKQMMTREALANLTQLLCSLDGLNENRIIVIGATNRPKALDPALLRPGRLHKIIYLDLPSKQKRLDLLKFYSRTQLPKDIDWEYFSRQTVGLSPAHFKAAMNLSALQTAYQAIQKNELSFWSKKNLKHTQTTIEYGIQSITMSNAFFKGYFKRTRKRVNQISCPVFFDSIHRYHSWSHVSLGTPIESIQLPSLEDISNLAVNERLFSKKEINVWSIMPHYIPRLSFETVYQNIKKVIVLPVGKTDVEQHLTRKNELKLNNQEKKARRREFYLRHRKELRQSYLFSDPLTINNSLLVDKGKSHPFAKGITQSNRLDSSSATVLQQFKKYINRVFKVHVFGSKLLSHSTYFINNPLSFSTNYIYKKEKDTLIQSSSQFTRFNSQNNIFLALLDQQPTLLITPEKINKKFEKMFVNPLALHRSLAYSANKAMMVHFLTDTYEQEHMYDIWARFKYDFEPEKHQKVFIKSVKENFLTRKQFENYLLSLSAGKVGEHLMLFNRESLPKFDPLKPRSGRYTYDVSDIGREELQQMTWLLNIMIEKNLFYNPSVDLSKQVLTPENQTRSMGVVDTSVVAVAENKERWIDFDKKTSRLMYKFDKNRIMKKILSSVIPEHCTYWWEPEGLDLISPGKLNTISSWTSLFSPRHEIKMQRMPQNLNYDTYRPNILKTESLLDAPYDAKYLSPNFVKAATKLSTNWNQSTQMETERLMRALLLDAFAKTFYILIAQRELSDYLSYYLLLNGRMKSNTLKHMSQKFLEPTEKYRSKPLIKK